MAKFQSWSSKFLGLTSSQRVRPSRLRVYIFWSYQVLPSVMMRKKRYKYTNTSSQKYWLVLNFYLFFITLCKTFIINEYDGKNHTPNSFPFSSCPRNKDSPFESSSIAQYAVAYRSHPNPHSLGPPQYQRFFTGFFPQLREEVEEGDSTGVE